MICTQSTLSCISSITVRTEQLQIRESAIEEETPITVIGSEDLVGDSMPGISLDIPLELVRNFSSSTGEVRVVSFLYYSVENFFPRNLTGQEIVE